MGNGALSRIKNFAKGPLKTLLIAALIAVFVRTVFYDPYHIPSSSMTPTLRTGDKIFVNKFVYGYSEYSTLFHIASFKGRILSHRLPARGDVVVFTLPTQKTTFYIKRIIGVPGDKIRVTSHKISINGKPFDYTFVRHADVASGDNENIFSVNEFVEMNNDGLYYSVFLPDMKEPMGPIVSEHVVPEGHYFMMGDNRANSGDSRFPSMGFIPLDHIVGRADVVFFSTITVPDSFIPRGIRVDRIFKALSARRAVEEDDVERYGYGVLSGEDLEELKNANAGGFVEESLGASSPPNTAISKDKHRAVWQDSSVVELDKQKNNTNTTEPAPEVISNEVDKEKPDPSLSNNQSAQEDPEKKSFLKNLKAKKADKKVRQKQIDEYLVKFLPPQTTDALISRPKNA